MTPRFCNCNAPSTALVEGRRVCEGCGERVRDAHDQARDKTLAAIARTVASVDRRLAGEHSNGNGAAPQAAPIAPVPRLALTREEAAQALGIGLTSFKNQVQPHIRMYRHGKLRVIPIAELERWLEENVEPAMAEQLGKES